MKIERIDHVGIMVKDVEKAKKFFADLFDTKFVRLGEIKETDVVSMMDPIGIEIFEPLLPDGPSARLLTKKGMGLSLLSLKVSNLDEAMDEMKSRGIRLVTTVTRGKMRAAVYHPKDTYGVLIELIEYEPVHPAVVAGG